MTEIARIGVKSLVIVIPSGWSQVKDGEIEKGDKYFNLASSEFEEVDNRDAGDQLDLYSVVIRKEQ